MSGLDPVSMGVSTSSWSEEAVRAGPHHLSDGIGTATDPLGIVVASAIGLRQGRGAGQGHSVRTEMAGELDRERSTLHFHA